MTLAIIVKLRMVPLKERLISYSMSHMAVASGVSDVVLTPADISGTHLSEPFESHTRGPGGKSKIDSSVLKSKNQATLFVNYIYYSFYDYHFSENTYSEHKVMCQIWDF